MLRDVGFAILFLASAVFDAAFIHALGAPLAWIPFHFIAGVLVLHRSTEASGALWFLASALVLPFFGFEYGHPIAYVAVAGLGVVLMRRIFTNRSVYALIGLGLTLYVAFAVVNGFTLLLNGVNHYGITWGALVRQEALTLLFIIFGLYGGFVLLRVLARTAQNAFYVRQTS